MRFIFMDEAGISEHEPVTVVVGVIAHADAHLLPAEALVNEILGAIPTSLRQEFVFSAKNIFNNNTFQKRIGRLRSV